MRKFNRKNYDIREISIEKNVIENSHGSCLFCIGKTKVICSATYENDIPQWLRNKKSGWVTAEYGMLPGSTNSRNKRESKIGKQSGRTVEIQRLIPFLLKNKRPEDNIVVLYDINNGHEGIEQFLRAKSINGEFAWIPGEFDGHFANWKNKLTEMCSGDWIFQIDADEMPHETLIELLPEIILSNPENEVIRVPRVNTVNG